MKRNRLFIVIGLASLATAFSAFEIMSPGGAPAGMTGSIGDMGSNCTSCHGGTPTLSLNWITSNIPASGYVAGTTYQITATNSLTGSGKYGFQVTAENSMGTKVGTLAAGTNNNLVGNGKYVTHNQANTSANTWTFNWTAPAASTGTVIFYGAFAKDNPGPVTLSQMVVVPSNVGIGDMNQALETAVGPNPCQGEFMISNLDSSVDEIFVMDMQGKEVYKNTNPESANGALQVNLGDIKKGIYTVNMLANGVKITKKIVVN